MVNTLCSVFNMYRRSEDEAYLWTPIETLESTYATDAHECNFFVYRKCVDMCDENKDVKGCRPAKRSFTEETIEYEVKQSKFIFVG